MKLTKEEYNKLRDNGVMGIYHAKLAPFAEAVFDMNTVDEVINYGTRAPDDYDMATWGINKDQWRDCVQSALEHAMYWHESEDELSALVEKYNEALSRLEKLSNEWDKKK